MGPASHWAENNSLPVRLNHTYSISSITVTAEGKLYARGLNSVLGCFGNNQSFAMVGSSLKIFQIGKHWRWRPRPRALKRAATERRAAEALANAAARDRATGEASTQRPELIGPLPRPLPGRQPKARAQAERSAAHRQAQPAATAPSPPFESCACGSQRSCTTCAAPVNHLRQSRNTSLNL